MKDYELLGGTSEQPYTTNLLSGSHWSLTVRRGMQLTLTDLKGGANVGMMFFNPSMLSEKYNAPDTLKCQHTFKLTQGHCLYSDMGRIFCAIVSDSFGWHESVCGNSNAKQVSERWGERDYQVQRNDWKQNGYDAFLVELAKYRMDKRDMVSNVNFFSAVHVDDDSRLSLQHASEAGDQVSLRFEMDTLVLLHTCPHPLNTANDYPDTAVELALSIAAPMGPQDECFNLCEENKRGYRNNALYHLAPHS
jgi:urea carboxylase-associated protein 2